MKKVIVIFAMLLGMFFTNINISEAIRAVACTQEAKMCPDGKTYVSRTSPNCEFSQCPSDVICTSEYKPVCGKICTKVGSAWDCTGIKSEPETFGNECQMEVAGGSFLYEGACRISNLSRTDIAAGYTATSYLSKVQEGGSFTASSKAYIKGLDKGTVILYFIELQDSEGKSLEKCESEMETVKDTQVNSSEYLGLKCEFNSAFKDRNPNGETYLLRTSLDYDNSITENNEKNNIKERKIIIGKKEKICPAYDTKPGCTIKTYHYVNGCKTPNNIVCEDDSNLSASLKNRADQVLKTFEQRLEKVDSSNVEKIKMIETIITRLRKIFGPDKSITVNALVEYLIKGLEIIKEKYKNDIDSIFDILQ